MRRSICLSSLTTAVAVLALAGPASADVAHTVAPGETLWSIAAANNLTTRTVEGYAALQSAGLVSADPSAATPAPAPATTTLASTSTAAPPAAGAYTVRLGDTLSGLAAGAGVSVADMAAMNGLDPDGILVEGTVLKLPSGAPAPARSAEPAPAPVVPVAAPEPTAQRVDAGTIQSIASQYGVSPSLAAAIAWQESGFNNGMVSGANARGVMQVMPGTWDYVQSNLAQRSLDPNSATDNIHAGVMYIKQLLNQTGGDENTAIAGYYQGLASVQHRGEFDDTQRYVANVQALRSRFGG